MASLSVFCTPDELVGWLRLLCKEQSLGCVEFRGSADAGLFQEDPDQITCHEDTYGMFLFPPETRPAGRLAMNDVNSRDRGWVYVRPGHLKSEDSQRVLTLSEIHGEDFEHEPVHPSRFVRWLKRRIKKELVAGVRGRNVVLGGESAYRDINYTVGALELFRSGVIWKSPSTGRVVFEPLRAENP